MDLVVGDFDWTKMAQLGAVRVKEFKTECSWIFTLYRIIYTHTILYNDMI
jgi:hypothetical protein